MCTESVRGTGFGFLISEFAQHILQEPIFHTSEGHRPGDRSLLWSPAPTHPVTPFFPFRLKSLNTCTFHRGGSSFFQYWLLAWLCHPRPAKGWFSLMISGPMGGFSHRFWLQSPGCSHTACSDRSLEEESQSRGWNPYHTTAKVQGCLFTSFLFSSAFTAFC